MKFIIVFISLYFPNLYGQNINFNTINKPYNAFIKSLEANDNYFRNSTSFQAKINDFHIQLYSGIGNIAVINFKRKKDFDLLASEITKEAIFDFKYCTDYNSPIVYNFHTNLGNSIRFNLNDLKISIEYPNSISNFMNANREFMPVFICMSDDSYAYHTNLKCGNLNICKSDLKEANVKEVRKYGYKNICLVCSTLR